MRRCPGRWIPLALLILVALPGLAFAQDATLEATLTYVGPGPGTTSIYRYDYSLTNNAVTPSVIELLVFFDSDPDSGVVFLGDNTDFNNTSGFTGTASGPTGWTADVFEDSDPNPWVVDFFNASGSNAVLPGQTLSGFSVTFLWKGAGTLGDQFFEALDGYAHEGRSTVIKINYPPVTGVITSDCTGEPLSPVVVDLYDSANELVASTITAADGSYSFENLPPDTYTVSVSTPVGYEDTGDQSAITGGPLDFALLCQETQNSPRTIGYWKHQANAWLVGKGKAQVPYTTFLGYLDAITAHFAENPVHPVSVYTLPASTDATVKLQTAQEILTVNGGSNMELRARQQLMALLLNTVSLSIGQDQVISSDGSTASQAITYCWDLIADGDPANDEVAKTIADEINNGHPVPAGLIPPATPNYIYEAPGVDVARLPDRTQLFPNFPNPVRAAGTQIRFRTAESGTARLDVFDVQGRRVRTLVDGFVTAGETTVGWDGTADDGRALANGVYFYRLTGASGVFTQKLLLAR
jgi:hypothetical protein